MPEDKVVQPSVCLPAVFPALTQVEVRFNLWALPCWGWAPRSTCRFGPFSNWTNVPKVWKRENRTKFPRLLLKYLRQYKHLEWFPLLKLRKQISQAGKAWKVFNLAAAEWGPSHLNLGVKYLQQQSESCAYKMGSPSFHFSHLSPDPEGNKPFDNSVDWVMGFHCLYMKWCIPCTLDFSRALKRLVWVFCLDVPSTSKDSS